MTDSERLLIELKHREVRGKKELETLLQAPDTLVYFSDACHPTHNTQPHYGWIKKGKEKQIAANIARQRLNLQGDVICSQQYQNHHPAS